MSTCLRTRRTLYVPIDTSNICILAAMPQSLQILTLQVITFDSHGISSHPNHRALSYYRPSSSRLYHLRTPLSIITKYTGPLNPLGRRIWHQLAMGLNEWADVFDMPAAVGDDLSLISGGLDWVRGVRAMLKHKSQMRWFRYGWVAGSGVMWSNDLRFVQ